MKRSPEEIMAVVQKRVKARERLRLGTPVVGLLLMAGSCLYIKIFFDLQQSGNGGALLSDEAFWKGVVFSILFILTFGYGAMLSVVLFRRLRGPEAEQDDLLLQLWIAAGPKAGLAIKKETDDGHRQTDTKIGQPDRRWAVTMKKRNWFALVCGFCLAGWIGHAVWRTHIYERGYAAIAKGDSEARVSTLNWNRMASCMCSCMRQQCHQKICPCSRKDFH